MEIMSIFFSNGVIEHNFEIQNNNNRHNILDYKLTIYLAHHKQKQINKSITVYNKKKMTK